MRDDQDKQEIIDELETYFSQLFEEETVPVEDNIKDLARKILVQTLKEIEPELPAKIQKTSTELLKLIQLSKGAMTTYFENFISPKLSDGSNFRASDGKRSPQGNSKRSDKSQDFDRLVEEIDKKMVTGYGNASLNSADLRQAISEAVYNPSQVQEVKYIAEDGEVFIDNMMVVVFLDVMNHLAPEGSIYAKTAGFFDLLKKMPRYANDIATARRELFKDGDYSAEQIRTNITGRNPIEDRANTNV